MKKVLVFIENGFEEVEALAPVDLLRRAGAHVVMATGVANKTIVGRNQITIVCDNTYEEIRNENFDMVVVPGGKGCVDALQENSFALDLLKKYYNDKKWVAAICAAPLVLKRAGVLNNQSITSYPSNKPDLDQITNYLENRVVIDGNLITSRGPGTAVEFALALVEKLFGPEKAAEIKTQVVG